MKERGTSNDLKKKINRPIHTALLHTQCEHPLTIPCNNQTFQCMPVFFQIYTIFVNVEYQGCGSDHESGL